jgi:tRNA 2-selenouridine synthase
MVKTISVENALKLNDASFIDTRSPKEFAEDNIPSSINIPIFSDDERRIVGTLYKENQEKAFKKGFEIYDSKLNDLVKEYKKLDSNKPVVIYCWRGGMRSKTMTELVTGLGYEVYQLIDGYKAYRAVIREGLINYKPPFKLVVFQGLAGCGKTDIIKAIKPSIDLEGLAKHRSSLFGAIGLKPRSQKMFESRLWAELEKHKDEKIVFIEGEANRIGNICVPKKLFDVMQKSCTVNVKTSLPNRVKRIVKDYFTHKEDKKIKEIISKLKVPLSNKVVLEMCEQIDNKDYEPVAEHLLTDYYDSRYEHFIEGLTFAYEINNDSLKQALKELETLKQKLLVS